MTVEEGKIAIQELYAEIANLEKNKIEDSSEDIKALKLEIIRVFKSFSSQLKGIERIRLRLELGIITLELENKANWENLGNRSLSNISMHKKIDKSHIDIDKALSYIGKQSKDKKEKIYQLLLEVKDIQDSDLTTSEKTSKIKYLLWTNQNVKNKILIGGLIGTLFGLAIFGTGGIGIAGLGGAIGVWGFLAGTMGGVLISSLIANFESKK